MRRILVLLVVATLAGCGGGRQEQPLDPSDPAALLVPRLDAHATELAALLDDGPALGRVELSERAGELATEAKALAGAVEDQGSGTSAALARALRAQHATLFRVATAGRSFGQRAFRPFAPRLRAQARRAARARETFAAALARDGSATTARTGGATD